MRWTKDELFEWVALLPGEVLCELVAGVAWDLFGDVDEEEREFIDTGRTPDVPDVQAAVGYLREELAKERPAPTVQLVLRSGELDLEPGTTLVDIVEQACNLLDGANATEICGEVLFLGSDGRYYTGTVEFGIDEANPKYVKDVLAEAATEEEDPE